MTYNCKYYVYEVESGYGMFWLALGSTGWFFSTKRSDAFVSAGDGLRWKAREMLDETLVDIRQVCADCDGAVWSVRLS